MADILAAVDLSSLSTFTDATGVIIVGIALMLVGIKVAKRVMNKA